MWRKTAVLLFLVVCWPWIPAGYAANDQETEPLALSIGTIRTEAENAALGLLVKYVPDEVFIPSTQDIDDDMSGWILDFSPHVELQSGEDDAFNGLVAKVTGYYTTFEITTVGGQQTPSFDKSFSLFPFSVGMESDRRFDNVNVLAEAGYVPIGERKETFQERFGVNNRAGVFLQGGYKFEVDDGAAGSETDDGAADQSEEQPDSELLRVKADLRTRLGLGSIAGDRYPISLLPAATLWYDAANSETYHRLEAVLRFTLDAGAGRHFDLRYEDGSGAPNFNEGEQFSANLTISF